MIIEQQAVRHSLNCTFLPLLETEEQREVKQTIHEINLHLKVRRDVVDLFDLFQKIPRPIIVDLNRVLASDTHPLEPNPEAEHFIDQLKQLGTVLIVTKGVSYDRISEFLRRSSLLTDEMILLTSPLYRPFTNPQRYVTDKEKKRKIEMIRHKFITRQQSSLFFFQTPTNRFDSESEEKKLAPIFHTNALIPIIDDNVKAVINNPGMLGIRARPWYSTSELQDMMTSYSRRPTLIDEPGYSLNEIVKIVRRYFETIDIAQGKYFPNIWDGLET